MRREIVFNRVGARFVVKSRFNASILRFVLTWVRGGSVTYTTRQKYPPPLDLSQYTSCGSENLCVHSSRRMLISSTTRASNA